MQAFQFLDNLDTVVFYKMVTILIGLALLERITLYALCVDGSLVKINPTVAAMTSGFKVAGVHLLNVPYFAAGVTLAQSGIQG